MIYNKMQRKDIKINVFPIKQSFRFGATMPGIQDYHFLLPLLQNNNVTPTGRWILTLEIMLQFLLKVTLYDLNVCHYLSVCSINSDLSV